MRRGRQPAHSRDGTHVLEGRQVEQAVRIRRIEEQQRGEEIGGDGSFRRDDRAQESEIVDDD